jgi:folate-binding protein YgfZ
VLIGPAEGRSAAAESFRRSFPPRLAQVDDLSDSWRALWLYGDLADPALAEANLTPPLGGPGRVAPFHILGSEVWVASATDSAPFASLVVGPDETIEHYGSLLAEHGVSIGTPDDYHAARIFAGWPALGIEMGEKTLPQEVRFETIDGVSFTKGCFIGQETVARVHFRGKTQNELRGLDWIDLGPLDGADIANKNRTLGQVHSVLILPDRRIGLGMVRREVDIGDTVIAGGREATIAPLPFDHPDHAA